MRVLLAAAALLVASSPATAAEVGRNVQASEAFDSSSPDALVLVSLRAQWVVAGPWLARFCRVDVPDNCFTVSRRVSLFHASKNLRPRPELVRVPAGHYALRFHGIGGIDPRVEPGRVEVRASGLGVGVTAAYAAPTIEFTAGPGTVAALGDLILQRPGLGQPGLGEAVNPDGVFATIRLARQPLAQAQVRSALAAHPNVTASVVDGIEAPPELRSNLTCEPVGGGLTRGPEIPRSC